MVVALRVDMLSFACICLCASVAAWVGSLHSALFASARSSFLTFWWASDRSVPCYCRVRAAKFESGGPRTRSDHNLVHASVVSARSRGRGQHRRGSSLPLSSIKALSPLAGIWDFTGLTIAVMSQALSEQDQDTAYHVFIRSFVGGSRRIQVLGRGSRSGRPGQ
jgi:hypothetical protein